MDIRDGKIFSAEEMDKIRKTITDKSELENYKEMKVAPTNRQLSRKPPKVGRNEPCPCGSNKKFKKCCLRA